MIRILIVEDEKDLANSILSYLHNEYVVCEVAGNAATAIEKINLQEYACIILDILLPGGSGLEVLKELKRTENTTGVIIVSAKNSIDDKVNGLNTGADDYLSKPFHLAELKARVEAIVRRKYFDGKNEITLDGLVLNLDNRSIRAAGREIELTKKEYEMILYFVANRNKVITKEAIVQYLWGEQMENFSNYDFIYTHIKNVRRKLMEAGCPDYIQVVYGMGYKFSV